MNFDVFYLVLQEFALIYPLFMAYLWIVGGITYFIRWEKLGAQRVDDPPELGHYPGVSIVVPAHNESYAIVETVDALVKQQYPDFEIIVVNDGSTDNTAELIDELADQGKIRAIHLETNQGKAAAMRVATLAARHEIRRVVAKELERGLLVRRGAVRPRPRVLLEPLARVPEHAVEVSP